MINGRIVFVGGVWTEDEEQKVLANTYGSVQTAANVLQWSLIEGLDYICKTPVTIISCKFVGAFPTNYRKLLMKAKKFNHSKDIRHKDYEVEFLNFPIIKHYSRTFHSKKYIKKICKLKDNEEDVYFIGYSMTYSVVKSLLYSKKINPKVKTCLIIPDLPEYMNLGKKKGELFNILKSKLNRILYNDIKKIDSFVLLTKYMYPELKVDKKPYTVVEGIAPNVEDIELNNEFNSVKRILYTGSIDIKYGICELVDAFLRIPDKELRLTICGYGDGDDYIREKASQDNRIEFLGTVNYQKSRELQQSAYLLVNPRNSKEDYTKFSFPSKTLEYMASGRPILMYKLKGIPDEYDDYLFYVEKDFYTSLSSIIKMDYSEIEDKGHKAKEFVQTRKNKVAQTEKIIKLLDEL